MAFRARDWRALSPTGKAVRELQRANACLSTLGVSRMSVANLGTLEIPAVKPFVLKMLVTKLRTVGEALRGSWAGLGGREGRQLQGGLSAAGRAVSCREGGTWCRFRARGWRALSPSGRAVKELQRMSACFSTSTSTSGVLKMSAAIHEGLEDADNKVEDCGGSSARKLGRPGRRGGDFSCREGGTSGPLPREGLEGIVTVREGGEGAAEVQRLHHPLCLGVLEDVGGELGGLEDAVGGTRGT